MEAAKDILTFESKEKVFKLNIHYHELHLTLPTPQISSRISFNFRHRAFRFVANSNFHIYMMS